MVALALAIPAIAISAPAGAQLAPPWDGNPISAGLGPTYGEAWCAPVGTENVPQSDPLALIPYGAIACTLDRILAEGAAAGLPERMTYSVIGQSEAGRDLYGVVVNALETPQQRRDSERWFRVRETMLSNPALAQSWLEAWGPNVKLPIFIEANIHGGEREGTDAMMQVIRDLVTTPRGVNSAVDALLDHAILVVIPTTNPDGRVAGTRANGNGLDMNRDLLVQSQAEIRANTAFQQEWLAPVGLAMHGYVNPTLIDGLTKPHNPGLEYDLFVKWNQRRLDANEAALADVGMGITRPVNQWNADAEDSPPPVGPAYAEGWDDWGPFYTQTYMAFYGVDGSTLEMCNNVNVDPGCNGRFGSKRAQYVGFYSSARFWIDHRDEVLHDQLEIFRRGVEDESRPACCADPDIAARGFTEDQHNWMVPYPEAFVIPFGGEAQRSDAEANRMVQWLLHNGIEVEFTKQRASFGGVTIPRFSYVVWMDQAFRGLAYTALAAGQDISERITQLYAPPGAWSHGALWGADVIEIPDGAAFAPPTSEISAPHELVGGVRSGKSDWYSLTPAGVSEVRAVVALLRGGIDAEIAEEPFTSTSGGPSPAGTFLFPSDAATVAALRDAGEAAGVVFERNWHIAKPATSQVSEAPRVAVLVNSSNPGNSDQSQSLRSIFGADQVAFVSTVNGAGSLQNAATDPLAGFDVIYNAGAPFPPAANATAIARLQAFFAGGGGYIGTSVSANSFNFLNNGGLLDGSLTQGSDGAGGGIARWTNVAGTTSPVSGVYPDEDFLYLPSSITYFSAVPTDATVAGTYLSDVSALFVAGLWRDRDPAVASSPMLVHGETTAGSRYVGLSTNPFSRMDAEREWLAIGQGVLWANLTDG
jgi:hypothetical protein